MVAVTVADYRKAARKRLPPLFFEYLDGGSYAEQTLARNVSDMQELALRQRVMCDVSELHTGIELFGQQLAMPLALGPVGFAGMFTRRGEIQAARAAHQTGVPFCLSTVGICSVEEVTEHSPAPPWYQLYMIKDRGYMAELIARVQACQCPVLVFTVDLPVAGARYRDIHSGMSAAPGLATDIKRIWQGITHPRWLWDVQLNGKPHTFGNIADAVSDSSSFSSFAGWVQRNFDATVSWKDLEWVRERWQGPILIKGILDTEDARAAIAAGADGLIVSNHGGRQLDGVPSTVSALPGIVASVDGKVPVLMDGGVRSGLDVLRALALGADACLLGRAWAFPLAAGGEAAVARLLNTLRAELRVAMALTGCTDVRTAGRHLLVE
ncbi:MAG: L-lactate dehydrogenase [Pseudomonadales bacterium]|nr:L-lactate dehydrogenase [Pseudomonadales bacterium]